MDYQNMFQTSIDFDKLGNSMYFFCVKKDTCFYSDGWLKKCMVRIVNDRFEAVYTVFLLLDQKYEYLNIYLSLLLLWI